MRMKPFTGSDVHRWRVEKNLTQKQAAEILGVAAITVQFWELGLRNPPANVGMLIERLRPTDYPDEPGSAGKRPVGVNTKNVRKKRRTRPQAD
jgi:transcriptional regulator with XRE-family HTH domain